MTDQPLTPAGSLPPTGKLFSTGANLIILLALGLASAFFMIFVVPKFQQIYIDALPGSPLPAYTRFIISARFALAIAAMGWPALGAQLLREKKPSAILWINIGILFLFLLICSSAMALVLPMVNNHGGMSDSPGAHP